MLGPSGSRVSYLEGLGPIFLGACVIWLRRTCRRRVICRWVPWFDVRAQWRRARSAVHHQWRRRERESTRAVS
jgi:hypothetical protein